MRIKISSIVERIEAIYADIASKHGILLKNPYCVDCTMKEGCPCSSCGGNCECYEEYPKWMPPKSDIYEIGVWVNDANGSGFKLPAAVQINKVLRVRF